MGRTGQQMRQRTAKAMSTRTTGDGADGVVPRDRHRGRGRSTSVSRRARLRYWFDGTMARGTSALVGWLAVVTVLLIVVFSIVVTVTGMQPGTENAKGGFVGQLLASFFHALDPGTVAGDSGSWPFIVTMLLLTVAGLFVVSALIGVIATGIDDRLAQLRRGRSLVVETDHTVVLGWSDAVFAIVRELSVANESRRRPAVVVLAERDKVEMEESIREKVPDLRGTRVVCRTGSPLDLGDLALTHHTAARSVIVLSPETDDPDSEVVKTLLALTHGGDGPHVVAEIQDPQNLEAARLVAGERAVVVDKRETVARLIVQTSRQSGAAAVYTELFDFDGDEIYLHRDPSLAGATYRDAVRAYETVSVIGLASPDGSVRLNPGQDEPVGDRELVVVAEDDSVLAGLHRTTTEVETARIVTDPVAPEAASRILVLGWNERAAVVVRELDQYAQPGSSLDVVCDLGSPDVPEVSNLAVMVSHGRTSDRGTLAALDVASYHQVVVLCYSDDLPVQRADARTLVTLLHLRDLLADVPVADRPSVVSEMLDDRNRALAQVADVDDVIVSDEILSLILTQLSEDRRLEAVFADLLDADGAEIYLRPVGAYVTPGEPVGYATLVEAAARRGETALGYRVAADAHDPAAGYGVHVNPAKSTAFPVAADDRVVVLADD
ncbi:hypothetical protein ASF37_15415 [Aeromicrobium sp. Leaf289]|uniref:CASTOR/POLLUX-related putative ion channel n=1 Tax=Aeromicrobium sp. Leaf289 TaxID=1736324 RepID=UPI00070089B5|nr:NAD-binding protein [Aeromicrobium sp. Leaf289]KQP75625.1 hypothetical protein ASF37_15415 [Aeromicrobium sp. Leaf289]